jgi:mRNA interferase MazF
LAKIARKGRCEKLGSGGKDMAEPSRGEIWPADLGTGRGHEQSGQRPVLVVSDDAFNAGPVGLVMVVPLTSKVKKSKGIPARIPITPPEGGVQTPSVILCDQLRTVSKDRLGTGPWGSVSAGTLAKVEDSLRRLLAL